MFVSADFTKVKNKNYNHHHVNEISEIINATTMRMNPLLKPKQDETKHISKIIYILSL